MKINPTVKNKVKYTLSFMCAGVPSLEGTKKIVKDFGLKEADVSSLRYRGEGWPGNFTVVNTKAEKFEMSYNDSWGNVLNRYLQFRCKICADGTGEFADITCADAWESSENGYPSFEEREGKSLIITRSKQGDYLLNSAVNEGDIKLSKDEILPEHIAAMQPYQRIRKENILARIIPLFLLRISYPAYNYYLLFRVSLKANFFKLGYNSLGMFKRVLSKKAL